MATIKTPMVTFKRKPGTTNSAISERIKDFKYAERTQKRSHMTGGYDLKKARKNRLAAEKRAAMKAQNNKSTGKKAG